MLLKLRITGTEYDRLIGFLKASNQKNSHQYVQLKGEPKIYPGNLNEIDVTLEIKERMPHFAFGCTDSRSTDPEPRIYREVALLPVLDAMGHFPARPQREHLLEVTCPECGSSISPPTDETDVYKCGVCGFDGNLDAIENKRLDKEFETRSGRELSGDANSSFDELDRHTSP